MTKPFDKDTLIPLRKKPGGHYRYQQLSCRQICRTQNYSSEVARGWSYFTALLVITFVAFWPSYFAPGIANSSRYVHFHAATAAAWMAMLIIQPWLIRTYRFDIHRALGRVAFILVPLVLAGMLLLANFRIRSVPESDFPVSYTHLTLPTNREV